VDGQLYDLGIWVSRSSATTISSMPFFWNSNIKWTHKKTKVLEEERQYRSLALKEIKLVYVGHQVLWRIAVMTKRGRKRNSKVA
jgi:hypothetical protein